MQGARLLPSYFFGTTGFIILDFGAGGFGFDSAICANSSGTIFFTSNRLR